MRSPYGRYGLSILLVALACVLRWVARDIFGEASYLAFYPVVVGAAALGGLGTGLLATILCTLAVTLFFDPTPGRIDLDDPIQMLRQGIFLVGGAGISLLAGRWRAALEVRRQQAQALTASQERLRAVFDFAGVGMGELDLDGRIIDVNQRLCQMMGYSPEQMHGRRIEELTHPEDCARIEPLNAALLKGRVDHIDYEKRCLRSDGTPLWVHVVITAIHGDSGRPIRFVGTVEDISGRKEAEAHQRESEERFRALLAQRNLELDAERARWQGVVEGMAEEVWVCDAEGKISLLNLGTVTTMGLPEFKDKSLQEVLDEVEILQPDGTPRPPEESPLLRSLRGEVVRGEERMRHRGTGVMRWRHFSSAPTRDAGGRITGAVAIVRDVTEQKQMEIDLRAANAGAEEANRAKDHFLAVLSHELRTPLTPVLATAALLEGDVALPEPARQDLALIRRNVELEARLIDDLLDVTRIEHGKVELDRRPVAICEVLRRTTEVCLPDIEARQVHFGIKIDAPPLLVHADAARLQQVFWNLIKNAVKFTPHGGCVGVRAWRAEDQVHVEVSDSGEGIAPEALARIFSAFEQADDNTARRFGGLGLGLAICRALVEMHGGSIQARSAGKGKGSTFLVRLPALAAGPAGDAAVRAAVPSAPTRPLRILLVEDHGDTARIIKRLLVSDGHEVRTAGDVATALREALTGSPDLLISDLGLPDGSGLDLMRDLRSHGRNIPGIALSGYGQDRDIAQSREAGFALHLIKPVSPDTLRRAIAEVTAAQG